MGIMKRRDITLDPEAEGILKQYKRAGYTASYVIRKALVNFYKFNKPQQRADESQASVDDEPSVQYD